MRPRNLTGRYLALSVFALACPLILTFAALRPIWAYNRQAEREAQYYRTLSALHEEFLANVAAVSRENPYAPIAGERLETLKKIRGKIDATAQALKVEQRRR